MLKKLGYFAAGFVTGGLVTFGLVKKFVIDKIPVPEPEEESLPVDDDVKDVDISEAEMDGEPVVVAKGIEEEIPSYSETSVEVEPQEKIFKHEASKPRMTDYSKYGSKKAMLDQYEEEREEEDDIPEEMETLSPSESLDAESELITPNSYISDYPHFDKISIEYYEGDDVLAEVDGRVTLDVTEDIRSYMPSDYKEHFGDYLPEQLNVRAHKISTDYEIVRKHAFFYNEEDDE